MKNPENYIYLAIIVISMIVSFLKKGKKGDSKNSFPSDTPTSIPKSFKDIFSDPTFEPRPFSSELNEREVESINVFRHEESQNPVMQDVSATKRNLFKHIDTSEKNTIRHFDVELEGSNDWQKAFIYSEIFNKKY